MYMHSIMSRGLENISHYLRAEPQGKEFLFFPFNHPLEASKNCISSHSLCVCVSLSVSVCLSFLPTLPPCLLLHPSVSLFPTEYAGLWKIWDRENSMIIQNASNKTCVCFSDSFDIHKNLENSYTQTHTHNLCHRVMLPQQLEKVLWANEKIFFNNIRGLLCISVAHRPSSGALHSK